MWWMILSSLGLGVVLAVYVPRGARQVVVAALALLLIVLVVVR